MKDEEGVARKEWNARTTLSVASRKGGCERTEEKPSDQKGWEKGEKGASGEEGAMTKKGREGKCNEGRPPKKVEELSRRCCLLLISPSPNSPLSSSLLSSPPPFPQLPLRETLRCIIHDFVNVACRCIFTALYLEKFCAGRNSI